MFLTKADRIIATGVFVGHFPIAPGTAGTIVAAAIYWFLRLDILLVGGVFILLFFLLGVRASTAMERQLGQDPSQVVVDEMVGFWIALFALPRSLILVAIGFFLFRLFDIWKPFPIRRTERLREGWGIMVDDALAGIYTNVLLQLALILRG
ncbi:phosphatidylglycerophosphatase A [bacterium]|nr:phosphatidylglycerophosphatase A [bacterium]